MSIHQNQQLIEVMNDNSLLLKKCDSFYQQFMKINYPFGKNSNESLDKNERLERCKRHCDSVYSFLRCTSKIFIFSASRKILQYHLIKQNYSVELIAYIFNQDHSEIMASFRQTEKRLHQGKHDYKSIFDYYFRVSEKTLFDIEKSLVNTQQIERISEVPHSSGRIKGTFSFTLPTEIVKLLDDERAKQPFNPSRSEFLEHVIREYFNGKK